MSDDSRVPQAALTADEWISARRRIAEYEGAGWKAPEFFLVDLARWYRGEPMSRESTHLAGRHVLAALCLYGIPEGFTHEDVELLNRCATNCDGTLDADDEDLVYPDGIPLRMKDVRRLTSLAARIAALLPPPTP